MKCIFVMERPYKVLVMAMAIATYGHILWDNTVDTAKNMGGLGPIQNVEDWVGSSDRFILTPFEGINRITDLDNEDTLALVGFSSEGIELVPNISENVTNIILNSKTIAVLENTQITAPNDLNFIEY